MSSSTPHSPSPIQGSPSPRRPRPPVPSEHADHPGEPPRSTSRTRENIPQAEHDFFVEEFRGTTIVTSLPVIVDGALAPLRRTIAGFVAGDTRLVFVVSARADAARLQEEAREVGVDAAVLTSPTVWHDDALVSLWIATTDQKVVIVVAAEPDGVTETAGFVAAGLRAAKVVLTDPGGGWGNPPRSFVELGIHRNTLALEMRQRGAGNLLPAAERALRGGASSVNLCRAEDIEHELFTFDGRGSVLTLGGYVHVTTLRVDDLPAVEALIAQGVRDGILKPRSREDIARMAVSGLGARVIRSGHLAGIVGLETDAYGREGLGEIAGLVTVSEFSGAGTGGMLVDGLVERARTIGLRALFAVTVSDAAASFFLRRGFSEVGRQEVPPAKWDGYDLQRLAKARCFWRDVA